MFGEPGNIGKKPIAINNNFHSQFKLDRKRYRDNNNFLKLNHVECHDDPWLLNPPLEYTFLSLNQNPFWESSAHYHTSVVSEDGGLTFINTET